MHGRTSSAHRRADGRDATIIVRAPNDARPFHCVRAFARRPRHRWRLVNLRHPVILVPQRGGWFLFEYCQRRGCSAQRLTPAKAPGANS